MLSLYIHELLQEGAGQLAGANCCQIMVLSVCVEHLAASCGRDRAGASPDGADRGALTCETDARVMRTCRTRTSPSSSPWPAWTM